MKNLNRMLLLILAAGVFLIVEPLSGSRAENGTTQTTEADTEAASDGVREVRVYYIETEDAGNILSDTWLPEEYRAYCQEIGHRYAIDPELLEAMIEMESSGDAEAVNSGGDTGLMQVNPEWHRERMERLQVADLTDPYSNILVAADYYAELLKESRYSQMLALMKYNMDHERAEELIGQGQYSTYAAGVTERMWELKFLHRKD